MQVLTLVAGSAAFIRSAHGWRTVCALITVTCLHPDAAPTALNALNAVARSPALSNHAFMPVLEAIITCVERCAKVRALHLTACYRITDSVTSSCRQPSVNLLFYIWSKPRPPLCVFSHVS